MAFTVSDMGVAILSLDSDSDEVITLQRVGLSFFIDGFDDFADAKDGNNPRFTIQLSTDDFKNALEEMGVF